MLWKLPLYRRVDRFFVVGHQAQNYRKGQVQNYTTQAKQQFSMLVYFYSKQLLKRQFEALLFIKRGAGIMSKTEKRAKCNPALPPETPQHNRRIRHWKLDDRRS